MQSSSFPILNPAPSNSPSGLTTNDVAESTNKKYVTDAEKALLANTSGTNTGDQDLSGLLEKQSNLSDLQDVPQARENLGLGAIAVMDEFPAQKTIQMQCEIIQDFTGNEIVLPKIPNGQPIVFIYGLLAIPTFDWEYYNKGVIYFNTMLISKKVVIYFIINKN